MIQEFIQKHQYVPPPPSQEPIAPHQPSQPPTKIPKPGLGLTYWKMLKLMRIMDMDFFTGGNDIIQADNWRRLLERNFESIRCPSEFKKDLAVRYLRGDAYIWWESVVRNMPDGYKISWETFREEFNKKYFPPESMDILYCSFLKLRQGTMSVREYEGEFNRLRRFVNEPEEQSMIRRFIRGLRPNIRDQCSVREFSSMIELVEKAAMMEVGLEDQKSIQNKTIKAVESHKRMRDNRDAGPDRDYIPQWAK